MTAHHRQSKEEDTGYGFKGLIPVMLLIGASRIPDKFLIRPSALIYPRKHTSIGPLHDR